jgi:hypothetical protein
VACVLRRLLRVCLYYGRCPQFLCCSATIANPAEHMQKLVPLAALYRQPVAPRTNTSASVEGKGISEVDDWATGDSREGDVSDFLCVVGADLDGAPQGSRYNNNEFYIPMVT